MLKKNQVKRKKEKVDRGEQWNTEKAPGEKGTDKNRGER